jgi:sRNA-binding regulator protein Hfq
MSTSRLDELRMVDPVLTTIAQGYSNAAMVAEHLFPTVSVNKLKGKIPVFGKEAFIIRDTYRAIRAASNRIPPSDITLVEFETQERDVEIALDYIEEEEAPDFARYEQRIAKDLIDTLQLGKEKEAADYLQNPDNYDSSLKNVIESGTAWTNTSVSSIDPIIDIGLACSGIRSKIARYPNTMIIGEPAYQTLINHPKLIERIKYSGIGKVNLQAISELTNIRNIYVGMAVYSANGSTLTDVWNDNVILAYIDQNEKESRSEYNPSFGYTFRREGKPEVDVYYENGGKIKVVRCTDNYTLKVTSTDAAFLIYNTNH